MRNTALKQTIAELRSRMQQEIAQTRESYGTAIRSLQGLDSKSRNRAWAVNPAASEDGSATRTVITPHRKRRAPMSEQARLNIGRGRRAWWKRHKAEALRQARSRAKTNRIGRGR